MNWMSTTTVLISTPHLNQITALMSSINPLWQVLVHNYSHRPCLKEASPVASKNIIICLKTKSSSKEPPQPTSNIRCTYIVHMSHNWFLSSEVMNGRCHGSCVCVTALLRDCHGVKMKSKRVNRRNDRRQTNESLGWQPLHKTTNNPNHRNIYT